MATSTTSGLSASPSDDIYPLPMNQVEKVAKHFLANNSRGHSNLKLDRVAKEALHRATNIFLLYAATLAEEERDERLLRIVQDDRRKQQQQPSLQSTSTNTKSSKDSNKSTTTSSKINRNSKITEKDVEDAMLLAGFNRFLLSDSSDDDDVECNDGKPPPPKQSHKKKKSGAGDFGLKRTR